MTNSLNIERYTTLVRLLSELTPKIVYTQSQANQHFMRLWLRLLDLCKSFAQLAQSGDVPAALIILRTQLEIFARLQFFRAKPNDAWLAERANELQQWQLVQRHHDDFPGLPYSVNVRDRLNEQRQKWSDIRFKRKKDGREHIEDTKSIRSIFEAIADAQLISMSAYGLYQFLCGEAHVGMLNVAARYRYGGQSNANSCDLESESVVALMMSAWLLGTLAEPFLVGDLNGENHDLIEDIRQILTPVMMSKTQTSNGKPVNH